MADENKDQTQEKGPAQEPAKVMTEISELTQDAGDALSHFTDATLQRGATAADQEKSLPDDLQKLKNQFHNLLCGLHLLADCMSITWHDLLALADKKYEHVWALNDLVNMGLVVEATTRRNGAIIYMAKEGANWPTT